ncbi:MAG: gamma-glutamyl-gamma-aminobutyrate hydrolase family protein, partial [Chloroflexi bacterium]|nr:gamma-glutamyl-gamma-aminobutyrate hydrolase family protein [Chloroflexota bacterium]
KEALRHAGLFHNKDVQVTWVPSEQVEQYGPDAFLQSARGIVVPGGFGARGVEGMIMAARYAREHRVPYLGLCLGMQLMVVDFARSVLGMERANSTEFDSDTPYPVISMMEEQRGIRQMGGTMRLGNYPCHLVEGSRAALAYCQAVVYERHRHRYEFNNRYREAMMEGGLRPSGLSPDGNLVEISEATGHPFMVGVQFHPEFRSRPDRPHPLFSSFMAVAKETMREGAQHPLPLGTG